MILIRIVMARHPGGDVVIDLPPGRVRELVDAPACEVCGGRGLLPPPPEELQRDHGDRCDACEATGLELSFAPRSAPKHEDGGPDAI